MILQSHLQQVQLEQQFAAQRARLEPLPHLLQIGHSERLVAMLHGLKDAKAAQAAKCRHADRLAEEVNQAALWHQRMARCRIAQEQARLQADKERAELEVRERERREQAYLERRRARDDIRKAALARDQTRLLAELEAQRERRRVIIHSAATQTDVEQAAAEVQTDLAGHLVAGPGVKSEADDESYGEESFASEEGEESYGEEDFASEEDDNSSKSESASKSVSKSASSSVSGSGSRSHSASRSASASYSDATPRAARGSTQAPIAGRATNHGSAILSSHSKSSSLSSVRTSSSDGSPKRAPPTVSRRAPAAESASESRISSSSIATDS